MTKVVRYIVYIPHQEIPVSYNLAIGNDEHGRSNSLKYAKITAKAWYGSIVEELSNGEFKELRNYNKDKKYIE